MQHPERGCGVQHLLDRVEVAHVGEGPEHLDDLGEFVDRPRVELARDDLGHPDDVVALGVVGHELRHLEPRHHRPRGVVLQVVPLCGADERRELRDLVEGEEVVVVAEERLPFLAVLPPPRGPQRDEVALGQRELDGDDVAGHGDQG